MSASIERAGSGVLLLVACVLVLSGCGGSEDAGDERAATTATSPPPGAQTAPAARPLPAEWYEDPDRDLVPTAVEREIDTDPEVDECVQEAGCGDVGPASALERSNTLLILDSSGSMAGSAAGGGTKLNAAKQALRRYVAGTPDSLALGFMVYGHKGSNDPAGKAQSCKGIELLDPIGNAASQRFDGTLKRFEPTGYTPLGAALRQARTAFQGKNDDINRIILVTDGIETCGGNPVQEARKLKQAGIKVTTDVVGFDVAKPAEAKRLRAIAEASGGQYTDARTADALDDYFADQLQRVDDLAKQYLCVTENAGNVNLCQRETGAKGSLYMRTARSAAASAGRDAEADEIGRLREALDVAREERRRSFAHAREAVAKPLKRQRDEARRRLKSLDRMEP